jgi:hypothetical protein
MEKEMFYQIHLYSKGLIEMFQNVFWHKINFETNFIVIHHNSQRETGVYVTNSISLEKVFDIKIIQTPEFEYHAPNPRDKKIIMHGAGKTNTYDPQTDSWDSEVTSKLEGGEQI